LTAAWPTALLVALTYAGIAGGAVWCSERLCRSIVPFPDGPSPGRPPNGALIGGAGALGFSLAAHGIGLPSLGLCAVLTAALVGCWYSDVRCGIVPDVFTLAPLAVVLAMALIGGNPWPMVSAAVVFVPFALAAVASRGIGMGWGDVKLVALGAAVLGLQTSILSFAAACLLAVVVAMVRGRRSAPIAFAPYLAASIALALAIPGA